MSEIPYVIDKWSATDYAFCVNNSLITNIIEEETNTIFVFVNKESYDIFMRYKGYLNE